MPQLGIGHTNRSPATLHAFGGPGAAPPCRAEVGASRVGGNPTLKRRSAVGGAVFAHLHQGSTPQRAMKRGTHRMRLISDPHFRTVRRRAVAVLGAVALLAGFAVSAASVAQAASGTGQITGYQGLCLDDRSASTAAYNPIQVYTCNGTNAQQWTVGSNSTLQVLGMCLDV